MARLCILLNNFEPPFGGPELQAQKLAQRLIRNGHQVIFVAKGGGKYPDKDLVDGVPLFRLNWKGVTSLAIYYYLWKLRHEFDILYAHGLGRFVANAVATANLLNKKAFVEVTTTGNIRKPIHNRVIGVLKRLNPLSCNNTKLLKAATGIVAISSEILEEVRREGISDSKIWYAPVGVDTNLFNLSTSYKKQEIRVRLGLPEDKPIIIFTGKLRRLKAVDVLLQAWSQSTFLQERAVLLLVGSGRRCADSLDDFVKQCLQNSPISRSVICTGDVDNVHEYLAASDIFAFPSRSEGLPNSLLEAMSAGLTCIASNIPGNIDVVKHGETGILVPVGDCQALYLALEDMIRNPAAEMGSKARELILEKYNIEQRIVDLEKIFYQHKDKENIV